MDWAWERLERMVGDEGLRRLASARVLVAGLGAVGGHATEALARAGVGRFLLVDCGVIQASNLNRQILALHSTLERPKVEVARERILDINPKAEVEAMQVFVHAETIPAILAERPRVAIDAIDGLCPKVDLIAELRTRAIPTVSSMGAALRTDPTRVRVGSLVASAGCPLAKEVRRRLRRRGIALDFPCVWSDESTAGLPPEVVGEPEPGPEASLARGRARRPLGSLPTITGIFGLAAANEALRIILGDAFPRIGKPEEGPPPIRESP